MPSAFESATLNLKLFDLRREAVLRGAREWFLWKFHPESLAELVEGVRGERNASFRMVLGYWDMAASLVTEGAIAPEAFLAAHNEIIATFSKIHPFLDDLRTATGEPAFCSHMERVVLSLPQAGEVLARRRRAMGAAVARKTSQETA